MKWSTEMTDRLDALHRNGSTDTQAAKAMSEEFGLTITKGSIAGRRYREGIVLRSEGQTGGDAHRGITQTANRARRARALPKIDAPAMTADTVPFLAPSKLKREYIPTGRTPVTLLASGDFVCKMLLPDQEQVPAPQRLYCGNPLSEWTRLSFCPACKEGLGLRLTSAPKQNDKTLFMFPRKRQQTRAA